MRYLAPSPTIACLDGRLHHGGGVHPVRFQAQLERIEEPALENDLHGRAQGEITD